MSLLTPPEVNEHVNDISMLNIDFEVVLERKREGQHDISKYSTLYVIRHSTVRPWA